MINCWMTQLYFSALPSSIWQSSVEFMQSGNVEIIRINSASNKNLKHWPITATWRLKNLCASAESSCSYTPYFWFWLTTRHIISIHGNHVLKGGLYLSDFCWDRVGPSVKFACIKIPLMENGRWTLSATAATSSIHLPIQQPFLNIIQG